MCSRSPSLSSMLRIPVMDTTVFLTSAFPTLVQMAEVFLAEELGAYSHPFAFWMRRSVFCQVYLISPEVKLMPCWGVLVWHEQWSGYGSSKQLG